MFGGAAEGDQHLELDADQNGPSSRWDENPSDFRHSLSGSENSQIAVSQTITTTVGETYMLSFAFKARPGTSSDDNKLRVKVVDAASGAELVNQLEDDASNEWQYYHRPFTATGASTKIYFADEGTENTLGTLLDDVGVQSWGFEPMVGFLDSTMKKFTDELEVAKWVDAFKSDGSIKDDFIDGDPDKFYVTVMDLARAGAGKVSIMLSSNSAGTDYDDDATEIELTEILETGIFLSTSQMLMSDDTDDDHKVDGIEDDAKNDRTHKIALGGVVKAEYVTSAGDTIDDTATVPIEKQVNLHVTVFTHQGTVMIGEVFRDLDTSGLPNGTRDANEAFEDIDGDGQYTASLSKADAAKRVDADIRILNERYAQVGIRFVRGGINFAEIDAGLADGKFDMSPTPPEGDEQLSADERLLFVTNNYNSPDDGDIEIYYVPKLNNGLVYERGAAFAAVYYSNMMTADLNDSIVLSNMADVYTLAHEAYHILANSGKHSKSPNLFAPTTKIVDPDSQQPTDTRRLSEDQEDKIDASEYAQDPT